MHDKIAYATQERRCRYREDEFVEFFAFVEFTEKLNAFGVAFRVVH